MWSSKLDRTEHKVTVGLDVLLSEPQSMVGAGPYFPLVVVAAVAVIVV